MKLDEFLPHYDMAKRYELYVSGPPRQAYEAFKRIDFSQSLIIRLLFFVRGSWAIKPAKLFDIFISLHDEKPHEIVWGIIGVPWNWFKRRLPVDVAHFQDFSQPGYAKMAWNFTFEGKNNGTLIATETRVLCTDKASRLKFGLYWFIISPFSGLIRREMLRLIKKNAIQPPIP